LQTETQGEATPLAGIEGPTVATENRGRGRSDIDWLPQTQRFSHAAMPGLRAMPPTLRAARP
jgi:hypothetical protein